MARPYSDDLRRKLLEAHDRGQASLALEFLHFLSGSGGSECLRRGMQAERRE